MLGYPIMMSPGTHHDNGGGLRYRATGTLKQHLGDDVPDLENLHNPEFNKWSAKLFNDVDFGPNSSGYQTALRMAQIPDNYIRTLVGVYGPESRQENDKLADTIIARRDSIAKAYR
jgi:hypothetical protein